MHVLIANDDGIFAPGIRALAEAARAAGHRVTVLAPDSQRSAAGHAFTLTRPLTARSVDFNGIEAYKVDGTPADCVRLGLYLKREDRVDYVLAGINNGSNRGAAILYSGTVAAAMEGSLCGVPAMAVSLCSMEDRDYEEAARLGVAAMHWSLKHPLPLGEIYNLNVPFGMPIRGVRAANVSHEYIFTPEYTRVDDGYLVKRGMDVMEEEDENSDLRLTDRGYASMSVLTWNLEARTSVPPLADLEDIDAQ